MFENPIAMPSSSKTTKNNYGAVQTKTDKENDADNFDSFDPGEEAYIHNNNSPLTLRRLAEMLTPILGALLILVCAIYLMWKTMGHWHYSRRDGGNNAWSTTTNNNDRPPLTPQYSGTP